MYGGRRKALTFSYDDGVAQDIRLIALLDKYGLKATFNLNSGLLGQRHFLELGGERIDHSEVGAGEVKEIYKSHEIAAHTLTHPMLPGLSPEEIVRQVEGDRRALEALSGRAVTGMAYPGGGENHNNLVVETVRERTGIKYARTILSTHRFAPPGDLFRLRPTAHHLDPALFGLAGEFTALDAEEPALLYVWGHSYELDIGDGWERIERLFALLSGREDIFYGTNREVLFPE